VEASINPHASGAHYDGLLGMSFLRNYKVEIRIEALLHNSQTQPGFREPSPA
jgi:hypothetical protein